MNLSKEIENKAKAFVQTLLETPPNKRKLVQWKELSEWRLQALKSETNDNAIRIALFNLIQKNSPKEDPYLPQEIINFLKPTLIL